MNKINWNWTTLKKSECLAVTTIVPEVEKAIKADQIIKYIKLSEKSIAFLKEKSSNREAVTIFFS